MAISLYELSQRISSSMPLGTIVPYYGTDEPSGWKICDGRSCAGSELAKKLGISNVPDLRGRFIRMIGGNAAGMAVAQGDEIKSHKHGARRSNGQGGSGKGNVGGYDSPNAWNDTTYTGGVETRPINMAFNYIIKVNTNVILYYVSNIIYKAIAIGKSLLSRVKEEVRRTMAISLNNHEDRITELENMRGSGKIFQYDELYSGPEQRETVPLKHPITDYDLVWVHLRSDRTGNQQTLILPQKPVKYNSNENDYVLFHQSGYQITTVTSASWSTTSLVINLCQGGVLAMYGLKLYYNFSYNIYRLTQILFDSSLLGLFSQKGGARTI